MGTARNIVPTIMHLEFCRAKIAGAPISLPLLKVLPILQNAAMGAQVIQTIHVGTQRMAYMLILRWTSICLPVRPVCRPQAALLLPRLVSFSLTMLRALLS